jgi:iron only hydrogenase large subunit-like protein
VKANGASRSQHALPVVILGTDAALAAAPATPVQLAHACLRAGFASVIPSNWGDELIASAVVRRLADHGPSPAIQCTCPIVAHRLLSVSGDLRSMMVPLVSPPVAVARYVRALSQPGTTRITYVGSCPGAIDDSIDIRMTPAALLELLAERQIVPEDQPRMFESVLPPDAAASGLSPADCPRPKRSGVRSTRARSWRSPPTTFPWKSRTTC